MARVNFNFEDTSPEQKLVMAILYTYFEDVDTISRSYKRKYTSKYAKYRIDRPTTTMDNLMVAARSDHTLMLCELINLDHDFFVYKLKDYIWNMVNVRV